jgi:hypothetical protein
MSKQTSKQTRKQTISREIYTALTAGALALTLTGCGFSTSKTSATSATPAGTISFQGSVYGGQQPIVGATIQLYLVGTYGNGTASTVETMFGNNKTDANGHFNITNDYIQCPTNSLAYLTATGGNPGLAGNNANIKEVVALGPCNGLTSATKVSLNELTTVASVYALSAFMKGPASVGATKTNQAGVALAFADVNELVNTATGTVPGPALPAGATLPVATMNTLANILSTCINSPGGTAGDMSPCGNLFAAATPPGGTAPTDTVTALVNIAQHPGLKVGTLFGLLPTVPPYTPQLAYPPNDWMLALTYNPGTLSAPSSIAVDTYGNAWIANRTGNSVTELTHTGAPAPGTSYSTALSAPSAVSLDASGNPWVAQSGNNSAIYLTSSTGSPVAAGTGGLNAPSAAAIDAQGNIWLANSGASVVTELNSTGAAVNASGFSGTGIVHPLGIAISPH